MKPRLQPEMMRLIAKRLEAKGYLGGKEVENISLRLHLPSSRVYGFASQFEEFPLQPYRARLRVCTGPACADAGAWAILEDLEQKVPADVLVTGEPGILRWHRYPAVCVETPAKGAWLAEGLAPSDIDALVAAVEKDDFSSYKPMRDVLPSSPEAWSGNEPSPWSAAAGGALPETWGPDIVAWLSEHPDEAAKIMIESGAPGETWSRGGGSTAVLVCDTVGLEPENSVSFAASMLHPRAVVAGAAVAAAACGAKELVFYLPWNEGEAGGAFEAAAAELLSGVGVRYSVFAGPVHVPCSLDIGKAAALRGMMLWSAASLYGWGGTLESELPLAVLSAELAWRLPWIKEREKGSRQGWAGSRLLCLNGLDGAPRLLEVTPGAKFAEVLASLGVETGRGGFKAIYMAGFSAADVVVPWDEAGAVESAGEAVMLDPLNCMPRWALYLAWHAERGCCGGCAPGRTAPAAIARIIQAVLRGEAGEAELQRLGSLLETAGELALCPHLGEVLKPIFSCLEGFKDEFEAHAADGSCRAGSCAPAVEAAT